MSTYYIDPVGGSDAAAGTQLAPWKTEANINTASASDVFYFKSGTTLTLTATITAKAGQTFDAYGAGTRPDIFNNDAVHTFTIAVQNVTIQNIKIRGLRATTAKDGIAASSNINGLTLNSVEFVGCDFHFAGATGMSGTATFDRCFFYRSWEDSTSLYGTMVLVAKNCTWLETGIDQAGGAGDSLTAHEQSHYTVTDSVFIGGQRCLGQSINTTGTNTIQRCLIVTGSGSNEIDTWVCGMGAPGGGQMLIESSILILGGAHGAIGIWASAGHITVNKCTLINNNSNAATTLMVGTDANAVLTHKDCIFKQGSGIGPHIWDASDTLAGVSTNGDYNIFHPDGADLFRGTSLFIGVAFAAWQGFAKDTHSFIADPLLYRATGAANSPDARLLPGSPAIGSGTNVSVTRDYHGRGYRTEDIGALAKIGMP